MLNSSSLRFFFRLGFAGEPDSFPGEEGGGGGGGALPSEDAAGGGGGGASEEAGGGGGAGPSLDGGGGAALNPEVSSGATESENGSSASFFFGLALGAATVLGLAFRFTPVSPDMGATGRCVAPEAAALASNNSSGSGS